MPVAVCSSHRSIAMGLRSIYDFPTVEVLRRGRLSLVRHLSGSQFRCLLDFAQLLQKLILKNSLSPGDILMLTAAVRDLHRCHPRQFWTDVRTSCSELWAHNPNLTRLREDEPKVRILECHYPLIHESNTAPQHFLWGFTEHLNQQLGTKIRPTAFKGDVHLSRRERTRPSTVAERVGC